MKADTLLLIGLAWLALSLLLTTLLCALAQHVRRVQRLPRRRPTPLPQPSQVLQDASRAPAAST